MSERRKILVISLGSIGHRHLRNARTMIPDAEIAVYRQHTRSDESVPEEADRFCVSMDEALGFCPDAVIVASPASEHIKNSMPFLNQGANLFIEKPLAEASADIDEFTTCAKAASGFVMVGYVLRFLPALHYIRKLLADEVLGHVRTARVEVGQWLPDWRPDTDYRMGVSAQKALGGGALLELSHELDYAMWLFGMPDALLCSSGRVSDLDIDAEDSAVITLEYPKSRVVVQVDFLQRVANMAIQIVGSEATLYADLVKETGILVAPETPDGETLDMPRLIEGNELYLRQFDFFFSKAFNDYVPQFEETASFDQYADVQSAASVLRVVDLAKEANDKGQRLFVKGEVNG